jgi:hypothetical protein
MESKPKPPRGLRSLSCRRTSAWSRPIQETTWGSGWMWRMRRKCVFRCCLDVSKRCVYIIRVAYPCEVCEASLQRSCDEEVLGLCCQGCGEGGTFANEFNNTFRFGLQVVTHEGRGSNGCASGDEALFSVADVRDLRQYPCVMPGRCAWRAPISELQLHLLSACKGHNPPSQTFPPLAVGWKLPHNPSR